MKKDAQKEYDRTYEKLSVEERKAFNRKIVEEGIKKALFYKPPKTGLLDLLVNPNLRHED